MSILLDESILNEDIYRVGESIPLDGMSRVAELENILNEILDLYDQDYLISNPTLDDVGDVGETMERAGAILEQEVEEEA